MNYQKGNATLGFVSVLLTVGFFTFIGSLIVDDYSDKLTDLDKSISNKQVLAIDDVDDQIKNSGVVIIDDVNDDSVTFHYLFLGQDNKLIATKSVTQDRGVFMGSVNTLDDVQNELYNHLSKQE